MNNFGLQKEMEKDSWPVGLLVMLFNIQELAELPLSTPPDTSMLLKDEWKGAGEFEKQDKKGHNTHIE